MTSEKTPAAVIPMAEKPEKFSLMALIFNSFYFFYYNAFGWFALFALLPIVFFLLLGLTNISVYLALFGGYAVTHVISAFVAPRLIRPYKEKYVQNIKIQEEDKVVEYFSVSVPRLIILTILSLGLYIPYWSYKNWEAVRKSTKEEINSVARGWILWIFYFIQLCKRMNKNLSRLSIKSIMPCAYLALIMWITALACADDRWEYNAPNLWEILAWIGAAAFLLFAALSGLIQHRINIYNKQVNPQQGIRKNVLPGEIITTVIGLVFLLKDFVPVQPSGLEEQQFAMGELLGQYQMMTHDYKEFCAAQGYEMQQFPQAFKDYYRDEYNVVNDLLKAEGATMDEVLEVLQPDFQKEHANRMRGAAEEIDAVRKYFIAANIQKQTGEIITPENWKPEYNQMISMRDMCEIIDKDAKGFMHENPELREWIHQRIEILRQ